MNMFNEYVQALTHRNVVSKTQMQIRKYSHKCSHI